MTGATASDRGVASSPDEVRLLWQHLELVHAVVYFAPEVDAALREVGLKGFWMGYFASRAAAMGAVSADVVKATFFNFHPAKVERAIPDAWALATPERILAARAASAGQVLRNCSATSDPAAVDEAADLAVLAAERVTGEGRPLAAAHRALPVPEAPVDRLWWAATVLREHRGDGHNAALTAAGISGCEAHVLQAAHGRVPAERLQEARGWDDADWSAARDRLVSRALLHRDGTLTDEGAALKQRVEHQTDVLAAPPYDALQPAQRARLVALLGPIADAVVDGASLPFPNPIGVDRPAREKT